MNGIRISALFVSVSEFRGEWFLVADSNRKQYLKKSGARDGCDFKTLISDRKFVSWRPDPDHFAKETTSFTVLKYLSICDRGRSRDSSVGIVLGYGLDDGGSRVRFPAGAGDFSLHHRVQNGSGAHPASYPMGTRGSFPGGKAAGAWSWPLTSI
jgi:hypothetical protein